MENEKRHITEELIDYALKCSFETFTAKALEVEKHCINDILACMLAASALDEPSMAVARYAATAPGVCTMFAGDEKVAAEYAALANGSLAHAMDLDDSHDALVHPTAVVFPAALAVAEHLGGVSGRDFLTAMMLGTDIACRIAMGPNEDLLKYGWNSPPLFSAIGALFAAAKLAGLDRGQMLDAIAMLMTQFTCSAEAVVSRGSVIRTVRDGFAAQAVVRSVLMAQYGIIARFETPLEGKFGFYNMYARDNYTPERIVHELGKKFETENITFKPWPSCKHTHTSIQALTGIMRENGLTGEDISEVHIKVFEACLMTLEPVESKRRPESASIAKSSMPFVLGTIMTYGSVDIGSFTSERLSDPKIYENAKKLTYEVNPALTKAQAHWVDMTVISTKGVFTRHLENSMGGSGFPLSEEQVREKFRSCCRLGRKKPDDARIDALYGVIERMDKLDDVRGLLELI